MTTPSKKAPEIEAEIERQGMVAFGRSRLESIKGDTCVCCGGTAQTFNDEVSRREFTISGFCQKCQDATFGS